MDWRWGRGSYALTVPRRPKSETLGKHPLLCRRSQAAAALRLISINTDPIRAREQVQLVFGPFCVQKNRPALHSGNQALSPWFRTGRKELSMNIDQNLHFPGPDQTAGQPRHRQDGASLPHTHSSDCRRWAYGRRQDHCPLPKGARPLREAASRPLLSGYAAIMLNDSQFNRDGFPVFCHWTGQKPAIATL